MQKKPLRHAAVEKGMPALLNRNLSALCLHWLSNRRALVAVEMAPLARQLLCPMGCVNNETKP
jgi:hypothetical protein